VLPSKAGGDPERSFTMKASILSASVVALSLLAGGAFAAATPAMTATTPAMTDAAAIKSIDLKAHQLTLADGKTFSIPARWHLRAFKVGQKVSLSYQDHMGGLLVTRIRHTA
jgi:Cu/Ag efflux protein CusF